MKKISKISLIFLSIFCIVLIFFIKNNNVLRIDEVVYKYLISFKSIKLTNLIKDITNLGGIKFLTLLSIMFIVIFKNKIYPILITTNILNVVAINQILKQIIQRPRPSFVHLIKETGFSFPSGHAMASLGFYGFLIFLINNSNLNKKIKLILIILLTILIILIGMSRVYLGVHYFSDIIGGYIISSIYLILFTNYIKKYLKYE